jgi:hypothetical protein
MRAAAILAAALGAAACPPAAMPLPVGHPARPDATPGRLAGPPASLRRGVAEPAEPAEPVAPPPVDHHTHEGRP